MNHKLKTLVVTESDICALDGIGALKKIADPFVPSRFLHASRYVDSSQYLPILLIALPGAPRHLLFFADKENPDHFPVWRLSELHSYIDQFSVHRAELIEIIAFFDVDLGKAVRFETPSVAISKRLVSLLGPLRLQAEETKTRFQGRGLREKNLGRDMEVLSDSTGYLSKFVKREMGRHMSAEPIASLTQAIRKFSPDSATANAIFQIWNRLTQFERLQLAIRACSWFRFTHLHWRYYLLREVFALLVGRHLTYSPMSGDYLLSQSACFFEYKPFATYRAIGYEDANGLSFVEIRDGGFLPSTSAFLFLGDRARYCLVGSPDQWLEESTQLDWGHVIGRLVQHETEASASRCVVVKNHSASFNLGHYLWNDLAGLLNVAYELPSIQSEFGELLPQNFAYQLAELPAGAFSAEGYSSTFNESVRKRLAEEGRHWRDHSVASEAHHGKGLPVSLKTLLIRKKSAEYLRTVALNATLSDAQRHGLEQGVRGYQRKVLVNIRAHNKRLLNLTDCVQSVIQRLRKDEKNSVLFLFEGGTEAANVIGDLVALTGSAGVASRALIGLAISELFFWTSVADVVVATIGSGLVIPTWFFDKHCLAHGDAKHINQMRWWSYVSESSSPEKLHYFDASEIHQLSEQFYSDYRIEPELFSRKFFEVIEQSQDQ